MADDTTAATEELVPAGGPPLAAPGPGARADRSGGAGDGAPGGGVGLAADPVADDVVDRGAPEDRPPSFPRDDDHGGGGGSGAGGGGGGGDGGGDEGDGWLRRSWHAVAPRGPLQVGVAVAALCFLVGALGFLLGSRQTAVPANDVDLGFLVDMAAHHDQAVTMAQCTTGRAKDPVVDKFA
jgi:hypothetical protein